MKKEIVEAIIATAKAVPPLAKEERNQHGGFNYVSIDQFYDRVASVALSNGLTWKVREANADLVAPLNKPALMATYEFDLMHVTGAYEPGAFKITIVHPLQGAQTAGSAMSYAEKQFMREVFKVVTGEPDADSTDSLVFDAPEPTPVPPGFEGFELETTGAPLSEPAADPNPHAFPTAGSAIERLTTAFLPMAKTERELTDFWTKNAEALKSLEAEDKPTYDRLIAAFRARKTDIKQAKGRRTT